MPPLMPSPSIAPTSSNMTGPRRFVVHDLGSVSIPQGLLTLEDLQAVLQKTTRALQALTDIVSEALFETCTCEMQGLKRGRLKMYGQDGAVGLLTLEDLQAVLQKTTRALQALTDIVSEALFETCSYMCVFNPCVSKQEEKMRIEMKKG
ncbi:hypothetical protein F2Q70_00034330 [Brassica cretica]|uniref:Uncharacterized protein n=1 Tax=Brassica cretica TaxID=69181 RepID=A0A8S9JZ24_BRACR|nr:hypothetical protein F2Q70_00034330 [Brassica cretica]